MKRYLMIFIVLTMAIPVVSGNKWEGVTRLKDGVLTYSPGHYLFGQSIPVGPDPFGYNYQAHSFDSYYCNAYLGRDGYPPFTGDVTAYLASNPTAASQWYWYPDVWLQMKWNDAWLANTDADADGKLDRYYGYSSYIGSGAWLTNHQYPVEGDEWFYFVKIVAAPADATLNSGIWYTLDGIEIGTEIWGAFATIQQVDETGLVYNPKAPTGWGAYQP
ncbi:MAG: hypothetical protein ACXABY_13895 [Candidatus Thorarchaeota archaeon]|jgi:hypothetical protein